MRVWPQIVRAIGVIDGVDFKVSVFDDGDFEYWFELETDEEAIDTIPCSTRPTVPSPPPTEVDGEWAAA